MVLSSCKAAKEARIIRNEEIKQSKEINTSCFIEKNDGTFCYYTVLKLVTGPLITPHLLADGRTRIDACEIKAYQNKNHYAVSGAKFISVRRTGVATETLPGFAIRIAKGKINVYSRKYFNGVTVSDEYFLQQGGDDGRIIPYTTETMNEMITNDPDALDFFLTKKYNTPKTKNTGRQISTEKYYPLTKNK